MSSLCRKAGIKLSAPARLSNLMNIKQRRVLMKSFIESQFGYCALIWMFIVEGWIMWLIICMSVYFA